jgi:hypothetical protein
LSNELKQTRIELFELSEEMEVLQKSHSAQMFPVPLNAPKPAQFSFGPVQPPSSQVNAPSGVFQGFPQKVQNPSFPNVPKKGKARGTIHK